MYSFQLVLLPLLLLLLTQSNSFWKLDMQKKTFIVWTWMSKMMIKMASKMMIKMTSKMMIKMTTMKCTFCQKNFVFLQKMGLHDLFCLFSSFYETNVAQIWL